MARLSRPDWAEAFTPPVKPAGHMEAAHVELRDARAQLAEYELVLETEGRPARARRRAELAAARDATGARLELALAFAEISVDNVAAQAAHLRERALFRPDVAR